MVRAYLLWFSLCFIAVQGALADCIEPYCDGFDPSWEDHGTQLTVPKELPPPTQYNPFGQPFVQQRTEGTGRCLVVLPHAHMKEGEEVHIGLGGFNLSEDDSLSIHCKVTIYKSGK